jgi:hypothetical protein
MKFVNRIALLTALVLVFAGYASAQMTITTAAALPNGVAGSNYVVQLAATGPTPQTWTLLSGALPQNLQLAPSSGVISGTVLPTATGNFTFRVQVSGGTPTQTAERLFSLTINPQLSITTTSVPSGAKGSPYSTTLVASGGNGAYTWTSANLPTGITLDSTTGLLSGTTPSAAGNYPFTVQVSDSSNQVATRQFFLTVTNTLSILTTTLPDAEAGTQYAGATLTASGGTTPYTWTVVGGSLPSGMGLALDGTLSGTPNAFSAGTVSFTAQVTDASNPAQTATKPLSFKIFAPLQIATPSLLPVAVVPNGSQPNFYAQQLDATSAQPNLTWVVIRGLLPPGINLLQTGVLAGVPTTAGTYDFTVRVDGTNPVQTTEKAFRIEVKDRLQITTLSPLPDATLNADYIQTLGATGGVAPYAWKNISSLPQWLSLSSTGVLSGRPPSAGAFTFNVQVDDSFSPIQSATRQFTVTVGNSLSISTTTLNTAILNIPFSQQLQSLGGTGQINWVYNGTLPQGLTLSTSGLLAGTPTAVESRTITITATDSRGISASKDFTITVNPVLPILSSPNLPATIAPANAIPITVQMASAFPSDLSGTLVLTFTSKAEVPADDPRTAFSNGTRNVTFTIPANTTSAVFTSPVFLSAGTVAGSVRLAANFNSGPQDVPVGTTEIVSDRPHITNVVALRTAGGLEVQITGYSTSRRISTAEFTFDFVGGKSQSQTIAIVAGPTFQAWFGSAASVQFGGAFSYVQPFTVSGGVANDIQSVTVRLTNAQGGTTSQVIAFK